jgi:peptidyl-prolyl cis-trans isomerase C
MRMLAAALALTLVAHPTLAAEEASAPQEFVRVDDTSINELHFAAFGSEHGGGRQDTPEGRVALLNQLVNMAILASAARADGLADDPQVKAALEVAEITVLAQAALRHAFATNPITDEELQQAFASRYADEPRSEFKARHILVEDEEQARELIAALEQGADFAELAKEHSTGPSGAKGGDLGWFEPDQMVPPFSAAVQALDKGEFTHDPVQTQFGWHVILLEDRREAEPVKLEDVRQELMAQLQRERASAYMNEARERVEVEVMTPPKGE